MELLFSLFIVFGMTFLTTFILYIPRIVCWFGSMKKQKRLSNVRQNKLAILVPARNESKAIGALIESIKRQTYAKENFDVHIIVKDHADKTLELIKEIQAIPHVIEGQTCKGDALDGALQYILSNTPNLYDGYIIVDADCVLADSFLEEMNNALASGKQIIQAKRKVKNYLSTSPKDNSLASACNGLIWTIIDDMGNRFKSDHNITNMTIGTGIMLRSDIVKQLGGWIYRSTLTEDIELMYDSVVKNFSCFYYSYAEIYVEESTSLTVTNKRRTRWLTGVIDSGRLYAKRINHSVKNSTFRKNNYYTHALSIVYVYIGNFVVAALTHLIVSIVMLILGNSLWTIALWCVLGNAALLYLSFFILTAFCLIIDGKSMSISFFKKLAVLFVHPIFYMGYIPIIARALFSSKNKGWEVIDRMEFGEMDFDEAGHVKE